MQNCKEEIAAGKSDVKNNNGEYVVSPNGRTGYYSQVQFAMFCCKKQLTFLYLWSPDSDLIATVPYDDLYVEKNLDRLRRF